MKLDQLTNPKRKHLRLAVLLCFSTLLCTCDRAPENAVAVPEHPDFTFHVKPLLSDRCYACHGPDKTKQKAGLALHTSERALAQLKDKPGKFAIVPGDPESSEIWKRIMSNDADLVMPPPESHLTLAPHEKELLRRWIEQGAEYKPHWAFTAPTPPSVPEINDKKWATNAVDNFVLAQLEKNGLEHSPPANRATLLRRVTFDLTGLPPTPAELENFMNDEISGAYERVVDRLLASPRYGERMATDWLDLSRYADSHGYQDDRPRTMWPWRDWVIKAFNDNLSYKDFVIWQLAGDLLDEPTYEQKLATGFNRNHPITQEGGVIPEEYLAEYASDRTHVFGTAFLGLTVECARCHTHKYDPILHTDYYQLTSFFNNITENGNANGYYDEAPVPSMPIKNPKLEREIEQVERYIVRLESTQRELKALRTLPVTPAVSETKEALLGKGLVVHYDFDKNDGSRTVSNLPGMEDGWFNYNLPPSFGDVKEVPGKNDKALAFDGKNYVSLGLVGDFEHHQPFSASVWIKHNGRGKTRAIFGKRMDELLSNGYDLVLTEDNKLAFRLAGEWWSPDQYPDGLRALEVRTRASVPAGSWQHVAFTYSGSGNAEGVGLFIGARPQDAKVVVDNLRQKTILNGNHFAIGNYNQRGRTRAGLTGFAGGAIDEFRLYDRELSAVDIALLTSSTPATARPQPAAFASKDWHEHLLLHYSDVYRRNEAMLDSLRAIDRSIPNVMVMEEKDTPTPTFVRLRGEYDQHGEPVGRKAPSALPPLSDGAPKNRLGLAQWLFSDEHPLTARVAVNRLWQQCFGQGIVKSAADFGNQGDLPTHPELLDHLALEYQHNGWDTKAILRLIVTSSTYRQSGRLRPGDLEVDPANRWLARGPAGKLTAEMLRDQALAASGLLNDKIGGKWVKPYQPKGLWYEMASDIGEPVYRASRGTDLFRRSLYTYFKRTIPPPDMLTMDAAERTVCTVKRQETSTPLQSLVVLNSPLYAEASRHLAQLFLTEGQSGAALIDAAFARVVSRQPEPPEKDILLGMLAENASYFANDPAATDELLSIGTAPPPEDLDRQTLAASTMVVSAIFNLDEAQRK